MLFENALYYPTMDILDEAWLKSAALLWDHICSIVPQSEQAPYRKSWSRELAEARVLQPYLVNPYSVKYPKLEESVKDYLNSPQGKMAFKRKAISKRRAYYSAGKDSIIKEYGDFYISAEKFGSGLKEIVKSYVNDDGYVITDRNFMNFYMTALANNICQHNSMALLTNLVYTSGLTNTMLHETPNRRVGEDLLKQGVMYNLIIQGFKIDPNTPICRILKFREKYQYEMANFRKQVSDLVGSLNTEGIPTDELVIQMGRLYNMGVIPALNNIQKALDGHKIKWIVDGSETIAIAGLTTCLAQAAIEPISGLAQFGLKIAQKIFHYNADRDSIINNKPFSMLYRINKFFNTNRKMV